MEIELGLKITHTRDDATSSSEFQFAKDNSGPLFFSRETATMFILISYLRGFKRENIEIKISEDGKQLTIGGKKPVQEITFRGWIMHKKDEIREFKKVFLIPDGVNLNRTKAKFNNEESTLKITMPKLVKGICGTEIQEVTEEREERHEAAVQVDDQAHGKECEAEISEVAANRSLLKDGESLEGGSEARIERKEKINDVVEKAADTMPFEKDSQLEQGGVRGCESITPAKVDKTSQTDGTLMEKVEATLMSKKEKSDDAADQASDVFQGDEHNQLEQDEFQGDKQDQVEQAFDELQIDKHDQVDQRDVSRSKPKTPPVVTDETSHKGGRSVKENAESVMENKMDQMVEQQHDEADQQSDVSRRELEIPQAMIDETSQKDAKFLEKVAESLMPSRLDQSVDKPQRDKADKVQLSEVSGYEPKMSQDTIDENVEGHIDEAQSDKVKKKQLGKLEIPEKMIDEPHENDGKPLERGSGSMTERKEDQIEKHLNGENQSDKVDHSKQMEVSSNEPKVPQVMVGIASQEIEDSQEDDAELMTESRGKKRNQSAEQVVDDGSSMEEVEAPTMRMQEKTDHVVDQVFAEIQGNEFPGEKQDEVGPSFDKFQIDEQDQMNQRAVSRGEPETPLVVTDETLQKVEKSLEEDAESMMERKEDQLVESQHDGADKVQQRETSRRELQIPQAMIDVTSQKDVKSREEDAESVVPRKVAQMVDKPEHDEADQVKPRNVRREEPEIPQGTFDEAIANNIGEALGDEVDSVPHREVHKCELEMRETMIDETVQEDGKPLKQGEESIMKIKEKIDQVDLVHAEQYEIGRNEPEVLGDTVDEISRKEPEVPESMVDAASDKEEKSYEDGSELMAESKEKKTDRVAEQVVDAKQHDKADHAEKCKDVKFLEEVAQPMMKSKKKMVDEHMDGDQQSDKVDYAEHTEDRKYEPVVPEAMVDAASQKEESTELMTGSREKKTNEIVEQVVDERQYDKADHVEKREIGSLEYEMPAVPVDETSPEDGKSLLEAEETMTEIKKKNFQVVDKLFDEPQCDQMDHARQRAVRRCEPEMPPAVIDDTSGKDGLSQEEMMEFVKQAIDEPVSATDTNQVEKREVTKFKNAMPDVVADETSLKDDNSLENAEAIKKSEKKTDKVAEKDVEQKKAGGVDEVQPETESGKLIPEEKSKEPENKGSQLSEEEKLSEIEPTEMQAIAEEIPQTIASTQSEEATPEKKELPAAFLEAINRESLETHQAGQEQVTNLEPEVARGTGDMAPEDAKQFIEVTTKKKLEKEERSEAFMEEWQLNEVDKISDVFPEIDSNKLVPKEKSKFLMAEEKERPERTVEDKIDQEPQTIVPLQLEEATTEKAESPITSCPKTPVPEFEPLKADHEVPRTVDDVAPRKDEETFQETKRTEIERQEGHVKNELQLNKVERTADMSPEMDASKLVSEEKCENPGTEVRKETEKAGEEKHDQTKEMEDCTHWGDPEASVEPDNEEEDNDLKPEVAKTSPEDEPKKDKVLVEVTAKSKISNKEEAGKEDMHHVTSEQLNEREKESTKQKIEAKKETKKREENFDGGQSWKVPQIIKSIHLEESIPKEKEVDSATASIIETALKFEPSETYPSGKKDVRKCENKKAEGAFGEATRKEKQALQETAELKFDGNDGTDQAMKDMVNQLQPTEAEEIAQVSMKDDDILMPEGKYEKLDKETKDEPGQLVEEKLHEREFKGMERLAQVVPESVTSKQSEENSLDADKHPVSSESYPEAVTPQIENSKAQHVERKEVSKQKHEVGKDVVDEQPAKDESLDEITAMKTNGKQGIDQVERQWPLTEMEKAAEFSAEMDCSKPITRGELEKLKHEMKEETEKAVEEKLDEGPKDIDMVPQTIVVHQTEEDSRKRTKVPCKSALHPKMTSDSDGAESHYNGLEEITERKPEVDKDANEEAPKKEEEMFQETRHPNVKFEEGSDQEALYVAEEIPKEEDAFQEITKLNIKMDEESDQAMQHVADDLLMNEFEGASAVSPDVDHGTLLPEGSSVNSVLELKEESGKRKENVDKEGSNTVEEETGVVPEIITSVKLEEFHPGVKEYPVISPSYQETPRLGLDISDTRQDRETEVGKWEPESVKLATDKMLRKDKLPPESADSQIKSENVRHQAEVVLEGESKTKEDEILATEAEPEAGLTMQSEEASPEGEERPTILASYSGSRTQESDDLKGVHFGENKVPGQDSELERFPAGDALKENKELAEEISELEMESKQEIDQAKVIRKVSSDTDIRRSVLERIDEEPKMEMKEETEKLAAANADKGELKKKIDAADTVPQIILAVKEEESARKKEECHAIPAFHPTPGTLKPMASETDQGKGKRVGEWKPKKTTVVAEEVFEKDDKSVKSGRKDQEESVHVLEHMSGDLQFKKVEAVAGGSHELDDEELISEEKSEKSEIDTGKETKGAVEEKVDEKVSDDTRDVSEAFLEVVVSLKVEEATHRKEEPHARLDSYPETTKNPEAPETQLVSKEISEWEARTIESMAEASPRTFEQSSEEETKPGHAVDERKFKNLAEAVEISPEMGSIKPMMEEKIRESETGITVVTAEKTIEKKAGEREIKERHGFTGEVSETIESTKLDGATPTEDRLPASTSHSDTKILDPEVSKHDRIGKQIVVEAALDEVKLSLEETEKPEIKNKEEHDHLTGHVADEWQFKKVEDLTEVSPTRDSNQMMLEEKFENPDIGIMEEIEKEMDEKVDEGESRKWKDVTELVAEIPATTFRAEEPPFREVTETSGVKAERRIEQQKMTEPITEQSQREEFLHLKLHEKQVLSEARSLEKEEAQRPKSIDLADVTDQVTQSEEPNVTESQPMKGKTLPDPEKQKHETSVEGTMRPQPDKVMEQVEDPVLTVEPQEDVFREHDKHRGVKDEDKTEKQEAVTEVLMKPCQGKQQIETPPRVAQIQENDDHQQDKDNGVRNEIEAGKLLQGISVKKRMKPEIDKENGQVEMPMLADEPLRDKDHRQESAAAPKKLDLRLSIEGQSKPPTNQKREQIDLPLPADEFQSDRDRAPDEDHGLKHGTEGPMKPEPGPEKEQVETPNLADQQPRDGDQGQGSETRKEKQELSMSFKGYKKVVPDKEKKPVKMPLVADDLQRNRDYMPNEDHGLENEIESEKSENEMSSEGPIELKSDEERRRVVAPIPADELPRDRDPGKGSETAPERQEIGMNFEGHMKPATARHREQDETSFLNDELPRDGDHEKRSETAPERQELGMNFEGHMKPPTDQERVQDETPFLANDPNNGRDHRKDEDSRQGYESELDKKESESSTEGSMEHESDREKELLEDPIPENQPDQHHKDHEQYEKQGRRNEKTPEKQEVGMSFEECTEPAAPDKKNQQFDTPLLGDQLQNHGDLRENEVESENILPEMFFEGPTEPEPDQKIEHIETTLLADEPAQSEIESEKMETEVIPEGAMRPETDKEEEQVETDKQGKDKGRRKAKVHVVGKEIEELPDEVQLPESEEVGYPEREMHKDFRIDQTSRKMDSVVPIKCKLRSFLLFAGSTFLLPFIMIVMKKSLIEFKSKKR